MARAPPPNGLSKMRTRNKKRSLVSDWSSRGTKGTFDEHEENATGVNAEKKKTSEERPVRERERERKGRKSSGKSFRFCTSVADGRTDVSTYVQIYEYARNV